ERIAERIGDRFHHYNRHGIREPLAEAKTDQKVSLKIMPKYRDNYPRYLNVIRNIAFRESPVAQRVRMQRLQEKLNVPETSELASLQLEAIGHEAVPVLKTGLKNPDLEVRFHAAMALAYLGEPDGLADLAEAVRREPAFRVFALAGMAAIDEAESHVLLRELLHEPSAETRYGAFRALTTLDENDPFVRGEDMQGQFMLHVLHTRGEPMVHLTTYKKAEAVLFGAEQEFRPPLALHAGRHIIVTAPPGGESITISRFEAGRPQRKKTVSLKIADVIRAVTEFGATYPDVAGMLAQADQQHNLPGRIEIDALPRSGRVYVRGTDRARIGSPRSVPNLYSTDAPDEGEPGDTDVDEPEAADAALDEGTASVIDLRDDKDENQTDAQSPTEKEPAGEPTDAEPAGDAPEDAEWDDGPKWYDLTRFFRR
ncbi:MAG: HEAT repeat domain-containing protein, partial [Planctomycetaceae bacterium]